MPVSNARLELCTALLGFAKLDCKDTKFLHGGGIEPRRPILPFHFFGRGQNVQQNQLCILCGGDFAGKHCARA